MQRKIGSDLRGQAMDQHESVAGETTLTDHQRRLDGVCDQFEAQWRSGQRPRLEEFIDQAPDTQRATLFGELLALELSYRADAGDQPARAEYLQRFPQHAPAVVAVFDLLEPTLTHLAAGRRDGGSSALPLHAVGQTSSAGTRFRILRPHARGGLGEVFVALDEELHREVALKEIQPGHAHNTQSRARFVVEAEITGGLEHPGIVPVYGLGTYADGRPFYAMRFIKGDSLKEAIATFHGARQLGTGNHAEGGFRQELNREQGRANREESDDYGAQSAIQNPKSFASLEFRQLLGRFVDVCNAIEYAHSRGVLHRDLKPGNIMLGKYGETLVVDWGLAKVVGRGENPAAGDERMLEPTSAGDSEPTVVSAALGTPQYMSPEQAQGRIDLLGPSSDVYGLGATLYALLTGRAPFVDSDKGNILKDVARGNFVSPRHVERDVPAALDAVCMRAMACMPADRYVSPRALADEIERWLADEPVMAHREPWPARCGRWLRRHRPLVAGAAALLTTAAIALAISTVLLSREQARTEARRKEAAEQRDIASAVRIFLQRDLLRQADPTEQADCLRMARGTDYEVADNPTIKELLDRAATELTPERIEAKFPNQPLAQAEILDTVGMAYLGTGDYDQAVEHLSRASDLYRRELGPNHIETQRALNELAMAFVSAGRTSEAIGICERVRDVLIREMGPDHLNALIVESNLADAYQSAGRTTDAIALLEKVRDRLVQQVGADDPTTLKVVGNLAGAYQSAGRTAESIALLEQTRDKETATLGRNHPQTLDTTNSLAIAYYAAGRSSEAIALLEAIRDRTIETLGPDHPRALNALDSLAVHYDAVGRTAEAIAMLEQVRDKLVAKLGPNHRNTLSVLANLAVVYEGAGRPDEAIRLLEHIRDQRMATLGPDHPHTLDAMTNLAGSMRVAGRTAEAIELFERVRDRRTRILGADHPNTLLTLNNLGVAYSQAGRVADAIAYLEYVRDRRTKLLGSDHADTLTTMANLALAYQTANRVADSVAVAERAWELAAKKLGPNHPATVHNMEHLASGYWRLRRFAESVPLYESVLSAWRTQYGDAHISTLRTALNLAVNYRDGGRLDDAERLIDEWLPRVRTNLGLGHPLTQFGMESALSIFEHAGKPQKGLPLRRELAEFWKVTAGADSREYAAQLAFLGTILLKQEKHTEAEGVLRECLSIRAPKDPDAWSTFNTRSCLGGCLLGQRKFEEAEALLLSGYEGMNDHRNEIPAIAMVRLTEALDRIIEFYVATNQPQKADEWRAKRE
jgi:serine/threonine protein kinase/tetratricopeptide (TPR) repeat protein